MTNEELKQILLNYVKHGNCFNQEVRTVLLDYKKTGGTQNSAVELLNIIKAENSTNQTILDGADDILDIATGYCGLEMLVWE